MCIVLSAQSVLQERFSCFAFLFSGSHVAPTDVGVEAVGWGSPGTFSKLSKVSNSSTGSSTGSSAGSSTGSSTGSRSKRGICTARKPRWNYLQKPSLSLQPTNPM